MKRALLSLSLVWLISASCQSAATVTPVAPPAPTTLIPSPTPSLTPPPTPFIGNTRVELGDITVYFAAEGQGEPLILLHGGFANADVWSNQVPAFSQEYYVITPDSRGHARTTDSDLPISYHLMAEDTIRLMDYLQIESAYIVGWSDGGITGIDLAINHPERVKALVAYGASISTGSADDPLTAYVRDTPLAEFQKNLPPHVANLSVQPERLPIIIDKIRKMWLTEPNFTAEQLAGIKVPVLVLDGEESDTKIPKAIAEAIPNSKLWLLSETGHFALTEKPTAFNYVVLDFLKDH